MSKTALLGAFAIALAATPAISRPAPAATVTVRMADRGFHPQIIRLKAGRPYRLRFVNTDRTEHEFYAPDFFAAARLAPGERLDDDRLNVRSGETRAIIVTPRAGHYEAKSGKAIDVVSNMKAQILVY